MTYRRALLRTALPLAAGLAAVALAGPAAAAGHLSCEASPTGAPPFSVELLRPDDSESDCDVEVVGRVLLTDGLGHDVYVIVDSSGSTAGASGLDLDGDGLLGEGDWRSNTDPDDSVLLAELEAVRRALEAWAAADVRVALVEFSAVIPIPPGEPEEQGRIRTVQGLTADLNLVRAGLDAVAAAGSVGATDYGGALLELAAEFDRSGDPSRRPVAFFLSDGKPTFDRFPYDSTELRDIAWALEGASAVASRGLPVHALEVGTFDDIGVLGQVAEMTGGSLLPELQGDALLDALLTVDLDGFLNARLLNEATGVEAVARLDPFGGFSARMLLVDGTNGLVFSSLLRSPEGEWSIACEEVLFATCAAPDEEGCTYTQGYWKNHHRFRRQRNQRVAWPIDEETALCGVSWLEILESPPRGDAWYILAHQWIAARLNVAGGAEDPAEVADALAEAEALLEACVIEDDDRARAVELSGVLDDYNNGVIGPGHCGDGEEEDGTQDITRRRADSRRISNDGERGLDQALPRRGRQGAGRRR